MRGRSWRWLKVRIFGLLNRPHSIGPDGSLLFTTRIQNVLVPPAPDAAVQAAAN